MKKIWEKIKEWWYKLIGKKEKKCKLNPSDFKSGFIWKPIAEHNSNVVVLLPANATGRTKKQGHLEQGGKIIESANYTGIGNGNREHYRFSKTGAKYPKNIQFVCDVDNCKFKYHITNPGSRYDSVLIPSV